MRLPPLAEDAELIQIVDAAMADATLRAGAWLACAPGCTQCCHGVFAISALDAARLRAGLAALGQAEPERADRVRARAAEAWSELKAEYPGDPVSGILGEAPEEQERFDDFANEAPCPVLDPETGRCDLYASRPMTCRVFGPPVFGEQGLGTCELCFVGASESQLLAAAAQLDHDELEEALNADAERATGIHGLTIVAFAMATDVNR